MEFVNETLRPLYERIKDVEPEPWPGFDEHWGINTYFLSYFALGAQYAPHTILEFGVRYGYCMSALALGAFATHGHSIQYIGFDVEAFPGSNKVALETFRSIAPCIKPTIVRANTESMSHDDIAQYKDVVDLCHVDGNHSIRGCLQELKLGTSVVSLSGMLVVDDFKYEPIRYAVMHYVATSEVDLVEEKLNERGQAILRPVFPWRNMECRV